MLLAELPSELLNHVAAFLSSSALSNLRLAARETYYKTFYDYTHRVLSQRWMLTREESLRVLIEVVSDKRFHAKIIDLRIDTHTLWGWVDDYFGSGEKNDRLAARQTAWRHFLAFFREQCWFLEGRRPAAMLTLVLTHMSVLRIVEIGEWRLGGTEDYHEAGWGDNRIQELSNQPMSPYECSIGPTEHLGESDPPSRDPKAFMNKEVLVIHFTAFLTALSVVQRPIQELSIGL